MLLNRVGVLLYPSDRLVDKAMFTCGVAQLIAQKLDPPAIYLKRDLVDSMLRTSIGGMQPPNTVFPAFFLMVPTGILTEDGDGDRGVSSLLVINESQYVNYLRPHVSEQWLKDYYGHFHDEGDNEGVRVVACTDNGVNYSSFSTWRGGTDWRNYENNPEAAPELLDFTSQLSQLAKNVILLMNHRYELLSTEQINPPRSKRGFGAAAHKTKPIYWLGKDFVSKKVQTTANDSGESTGGTVTPHWRRGHWHTYRVGQNRASKTTRWVEPCKVNWPY